MVRFDADVHAEPAEIATSPSASMSDSASTPGKGHVQYARDACRTVTVDDGPFNPIQPVTKASVHGSYSFRVTTLTIVYEPCRCSQTNDLMGRQRPGPEATLLPPSVDLGYQ